MPAELYDRILTAVAAKLTAALAAASLSAVTVYRRRFSEFANQQNNCVVVSYLGEVEQTGGGGWAADEIGVPVLVAYYAPTLTTQDEDTQAEELTARGVIMDALAYKRLTGVAEVTNVVPEPRPVAEPDYPVMTTQAQAGSTQLRSGILFRVWARRARAA